MAAGGKKTFIKVALAERSYGIHIGSGILPALGKALAPFNFARRIALVSNPTVFALYGETVLTSLKNAGFDAAKIIVPDGEEYKSLLWADFIYGELLRARLERGSCLVALGGGVIGDMTGFAASTYMRGIRFVQVPTTLLAQVDSSVGGKTGVNHPMGKNMIGTFWQPSLVWIDTGTLKSLPKRQFSAGMAEVIKYGVISDRAFFGYLERENKSIAALETARLGRIIKRSCELKAHVVSLDEREAGLRAILNYGHTTGHAVETLTNYRKYLHGEAVSIGMCLEGRLASQRGMIKQAEVERIKGLCAAFKLPVEIPRGLLEPAGMVAAMQVDKKVSGGQIKVVLPERIGAVRVESVENEELRSIIF
ncbi:MAG: 3-dehydroquinate synthase [Nitrospiraceae bacterium]|nr:3-dehydroquinate synthase [Nitrospiraceae bacterium]